MFSISSISLYSIILLVINLKAELILQVHDELIIEASLKDAQKAKEILVREMQDAVKLSVPLEVQAEIGLNWEACHS